MNSKRLQLAGTFAAAIGLVLLAGPAYPQTGQPAPAKPFGSAPSSGMPNTVVKDRETKPVETGLIAAENVRAKVVKAHIAPLSLKKWGVDDECNLRPGDTFVVTVRDPATKTAVVEKQRRPKVRWIERDTCASDEQLRVDLGAVDKAVAAQKAAELEQAAKSVGRGKPKS